MSKMIPLWFFLLVCVYYSKGQNEGQSCISKNDVVGVCKNIVDCQSAIDELRNKRKPPQICGFIDTDPIVCCVDVTALPPSTTTTTTTTTTRQPVATTVKQTITSTTEYVPPFNDYIELEPQPECKPIPWNMTAPRTGQIAWDKCIEYQEKYVYPCEPSKALVGGPVRNNNCKHNANQLIVNGESATEGEFPHMALLGFSSDDKVISFLCGGSVISDKFILTAGHCTYTKDLGAVAYALVGTLKRSDEYDSSNLYSITRIHKHPDYMPPQRYHDIALLETDKRMRLHQFVVPACLDVGKETEDDALATGWGATSNRGSNADTLQKVKLKKFTDEECSKSVRPYRLMKKGIDPKTQLCYGDKLESKDTCQGDSGGPLQIKSKKINCMYVIVGVTSFGRQCGVVGEPGIYTRVAEYVPWIESVVWP